MIIVAGNAPIPHPDDHPIQHEQPSSGAENESGAGWQQKLHYLRTLAELVQQEGLSELVVENQGVKWSVKGETRSEMPASPLEYRRPAPTTLPVARVIPIVADVVAIVTPVVGVFYRAPSPTDPPFVEVGDRVEIGQTVGLVEAMKVFNEITSEVEGFVAQIMADSGDLVETGNTLMTIRK